MKHRREGKAEKWAMLLTELPREPKILMKSDAKGLSRLAQPVEYLHATLNL